MDMESIPGIAGIRGSCDNCAANNSYRTILESVRGQEERIPSPRGGEGSLFSLGDYELLDEPVGDVGHPNCHVVTHSMLAAAWQIYLSRPSTRRFSHEAQILLQRQWLSGFHPALPPALPVAEARRTAQA